MQKGDLTTVTAIASRDRGKARAAAAALGIQKAYGSYEELLADPEIDAIYNPLPNHLHVPWTIQAAEAGKHVLCEKPIGLSSAEARTLLDVRDRTGVRIQEAFMVRTHPQWLAARELVHRGRIGDLRAMLGVFSYFNDDPANIRNVPDVRRRRADGHRLLSDQHLAVHHRPRARACRAAPSNATRSSAPIV